MQFSPWHAGKDGNLVSKGIQIIKKKRTKKVLGILYYRGLLKVIVDQVKGYLIDKVISVIIMPASVNGCPVNIIFCV